MKELLLATLFMIASSSMSLAAWFSPTDMRYINEYPEMGERFKLASQHVVDWNGMTNDIYEARNLLEAILEKEPNFAPAYVQYNFLLSQIMQGKNHEMLKIREQLLLKAIEVEPNYERAFVNLAELYREMERYKDAELYVKRAKKTGVYIPFLKFVECRLLDSQGKFNEGFQKCMECISENSNDKRLASKILSYLQIHYNRTGDLEQLDTIHRTLIEIEPEDATKWGAYATFLLFRRGEYENAIAKAKKAISISNYKYVRSTLACALYTKWAHMIDKGIDDMEATKVFEEAKAIEPDLMEAINMFGNWKYENNTTKLAIDRLKAILEKSETGLPDLIITIESPPETSIKDKLIRQRDIKVIVKNQGESSASNIGVDLVLSTDPVIPVKYAIFEDHFKEDMLIRGGSAGVTYIQPGGSVEVDFGVDYELPDDIVVGSYYLGVVVDPGNKVEEINEDNNVASSILDIF